MPVVQRPLSRSSSQTTATSGLVNLSSSLTNASSASVSAAEQPSLDKWQLYLNNLYDSLPSKIQALRSLHRIIRIPSTTSSKTTADKNSVGGLVNDIIDRRAVGFLMKQDVLVSALTRIQIEEGRKYPKLSSLILGLFCIYLDLAIDSDGNNEKGMGEEAIGQLSRFRVGDSCIRQLQLIADNMSLSSIPVSVLPGSATSTGEHEWDAVICACVWILMRMGQINADLELKIVKRGVSSTLLTILKNLTSVTESRKECVILVMEYMKRLVLHQGVKEGMVDVKQQLIEVFHSDLVRSDRQVMYSSLVLMINFANYKYHADWILESCQDVLELHISQHSADSAYLCMKLLDVALRQCTDRSETPASHQIITLVMKRAVESPPTQRLHPDLASLLCTLASDKPTALLMAGVSDQSPFFGVGLKMLLLRAIKSSVSTASSIHGFSDLYAWKVVRRILLHQDGEIVKSVLPVLGDLMRFVQKKLDTLKPSIQVEVLSVLGCISLPNLDYYKLVTSFSLLDIIQREMQRCHSRESVDASCVLLECVILLGTLGQDHQVCSLLSAPHPLLMHLLDLLTRSHDPELLAQVMFTLYRLSRSPECFQYLGSHPSFQPRVESLLVDPTSHPVVKQQADYLLWRIQEWIGKGTKKEDGAAQQSEAARILNLRFRAFNPHLITPS